MAPAHHLVPPSPKAANAWDDNPDTKAVRHGARVREISPRIVCVARGDCNCCGRTKASRGLARRRSQRATGATRPGPGGHTGRAIPPDAAQGASRALAHHGHSLQSGSGVTGPRTGQPGAGAARGTAAPRAAAARSRAPRRYPPPEPQSHAVAWVLVSGRCQQPAAPRSRVRHAPSAQALGHIPVGQTPAPGFRQGHANRRKLLSSQNRYVFPATEVAPIPGAALLRFWFWFWFEIWIFIQPPCSWT